MLAFCVTQQSSQNGHFSSCIISDVAVYFLPGIIKAKLLDSIPWRLKCCSQFEQSSPKREYFHSNLLILTINCLCLLTGGRQQAISGLRQTLGTGSSICQWCFILLIGDLSIRLTCLGRAPLLCHGYGSFRDQHRGLTISLLTEEMSVKVIHCIVCDCLKQLWHNLALTYVLF